MGAPFHFASVFCESKIYDSLLFIYISYKNEKLNMNLMCFQVHVFVLINLW